MSILFRITYKKVEVQISHILLLLFLFLFAVFQFLHCRNYHRYDWSFPSDINTVHYLQPLTGSCITSPSFSFLNFPRNFVICGRWLSVKPGEGGCLDGTQLLHQNDGPSQNRTDRLCFCYAAENQASLKRTDEIQHIIIRV